MKDWRPAAITCSARSNVRDFGGIELVEVLDGVYVWSADVPLVVLVLRIKENQRVHKEGVMGIVMREWMSPLVSCR